MSIPGIRTEGTSAEQYAEQARTLYESAQLSDPDSSTATIAWIGYDAPSGNDIGKAFTESISNIGQIVVGDYDEVNLADHVYDPWYSSPIDPEADRTPTPTVDADDIRGRRE